jgi:hypothetical protein
VKKSSESEHKRFIELVDALVRVPHSEIKAKLDAEKQARKRKKSKKSSASREANDRV